MYTANELNYLDALRKKDAAINAIYTAWSGVNRGYLPHFGHAETQFPNMVALAYRCSGALIDAMDVLLEEHGNAYVFPLLSDQKK